MSHLTGVPTPPRGSFLPLDELLEPVAELLTERLERLDPNDPDWFRVVSLCQKLREVAGLPPMRLFGPRRIV